MFKPLWIKLRNWFYGWPYEPRTPKRYHSVKLNPVKVAFIRAIHEDYTQQEIADMMGCSQQAVSDVVTGKTWAGV